MSGERTFTQVPATWNEASTEPLIEMSGEVEEAAETIRRDKSASTEPLIEMSGETT